MKPPKTTHDKFETLRKRAEASIRAPDFSKAPLEFEDSLQLIHELQTFQVELELQNDELQRSQQELMNAQTRYTDLYDFAPVGYITLNLKRMILNANHTLSDMLLIDKRDILDHPLSDFILFEDQDIFYRYWRTLSTPTPRQFCELRLKKKDGTPFAVQLESTLFSSAGSDIKQYHTVIIDITQRKQTEKELELLRNYLSNIIDSMPSVLIGVDADGRVSLWNKRAEQTTGIPAADAFGSVLSHVFPKLAPNMKEIIQSILTREIKQERKRHGPSGISACYEDITIYPLVSRGVKGAVIRIDDVTEKIRMEERMVQSEKMLSVGGLAAGLAHEINNPLAGMIQTAHVLSTRLTSGDLPDNLKAAQAAGTTMEAIRQFMEAREIPRMIINIKQSGMRAAEVVDNMLSFAQKCDTRKQFHSLTELLDKTLELASTNYDLTQHYDFRTIKIKKEYEANLPPVPCECPMIRQVLLNILRNGAQAMQETEKQTPCFIIRARLDREHKMVCMEIEDNGPGMDEKISKRVFEPFFTTKPVGMGTGLGLSVSYFIITENHHGKMTVTSEPGKGATFIICLPLERKKE